MSKLDRAWRCSVCGWLNPIDAKACASCSKRKPRAKKPKPPPSFRPWRCVVLALDAAESTGWAVWTCGCLSSSGEFKIGSDDGVAQTVRVVDEAKMGAARLDLPWVAVIERSWGGAMSLAKTHSHGWWEFAIRNAQLPRAMICGVYPATWRARTLPRGMHAAPREQTRRVEVEAARVIAPGVVRMGSDQAAAILIGKWATQAGEVGEALPPNARGTA